MSGSTSPKLAPNLHGALRDVRDVYIFAPKRGFDQLPVLYFCYIYLLSYPKYCWESSLKMQNESSQFLNVTSSLTESDGYSPDIEKLLRKAGNLK